ncbi:MAG: hypothetical protein ABJE95_03860 [Byssovorax sp.]
MEKLVMAHAALDEPMETAIWIRQNDREAWLVEVIPSLPEDEHPERPVAFNPGLGFRHPLNLLAGNRASVETAVRVDRDLAQTVAQGVVLYGAALGEELKALAAQLANGYAQAG